MSKALLFTALLIAGIISQPLTAHAHVLLTDDSGQTGAILHINPDDDPVAGEPSTLFFDIQNQSFSSHAHQVSLTVTDEEGVAADVPVSVANSSASATYIFPAQGAYRITLSAAADGAATAHAHTFTHTQRVSRGAAGSVLDKPVHVWAEAGIVASVCGLLVLAIVTFNRRKEIADCSKL